VNNRRPLTKSLTWSENLRDKNDPRMAIIGAEKLTDLYGGWISFHDASIESVLIERRGPTVTIEFETCDMAYRGDELLDSDRKARVIVSWHKVQELSLAGVDPEEHNWIDGLAFTPVGEDVRGELELMDGMHGVIVARQVEIVDVEPR
jgi:Immunity protein 50